MPYILGVDGGNSKTIAILASLDGTIVGFGRGGCGDIYNAEPDEHSPDSVAAALANVDHAVHNALSIAGCAPSDILTGVFNMAGADWPEDFDLIHAAMTSRGYGRQITVQNDAMGALYGGSPDAIGVSIVCGTGTATGARGLDGRIWHTSYWQDEAQGSTHLAQKVLFAIYRSELGIEPPTSLTTRILNLFQLSTVEEVLHLFTGREMHPPSDTSPLTTILLDEAQAGDSVALHVVRLHGAALGDIALAAARKVGIVAIPFTLVLAGGVFRHPSTTLADAIIEQVWHSSPEVQPSRSPHEPIIGVLIKGFQDSDILVSESILEQLISTVPPRSFFATATHYWATN